MINMQIYKNDYEKLNKLKPIFAFDTETNGLKYDEMLIKDITFCDGDICLYFDKNNLDFNLLKNIFYSAKLIIGHNLTYDLTVLSKNFGRDFLLNLNGSLFDTMIAQYIIDENEHKGLKYLSEKLLNYKMIEYTEAIKGSKNIWEKYCTDDVIQTWKLFKYFMPLLKNDINIFKREMECIPAIVDMQNNGFLIDKEKLIEIKSKLELKLKELNKKFSEILQNTNSIQRSLFGVKMNIDLNSPQQVKNFINSNLGFNIQNTSVKTLNDIKKKDSSGFIELLLQYRGISKLYNTYILPFENEHIQSDNKIHAMFNQTGTVTGRFSSQNPNMQNQPSQDEFGLRDIFIAEPNNILFSADFASQELRLAAIVSNDEKMISAFNEGKDLHLMTANSAYNLNIPDEYLITTNEKYEEYKNKFGKERKKAKFINFGILYGASAYGVSNLTGEDENKSKEMVENYYNYYKGIKEMKSNAERFVQKNKYVENMFGRKRRFNEINSNAKRQAVNFLIQGTAADMLKICLGRVWKLVKENPEIKIISTIHDEIIIQVPINKKDDYKYKLRNIMEDWDFCIPMVSEIGEGNSYGSAH